MLDSSTSIFLHTTRNPKTSRTKHNKSSERSAALKYPRHAHAGTIGKGVESSG